MTRLLIKKWMNLPDCKARLGAYSATLKKVS